MQKYKYHCTSYCSVVISIIASIEARMINVNFAKIFHMYLTHVYALKDKYSCLKFDIYICASSCMLQSRDTPEAPRATLPFLCPDLLVAGLRAVVVRVVVVVLVVRY